MKKGFSILLVLLIFWGCSSKSKPDHKINEGIITYSVSYFSTEKENPIISLLPNKVELLFKNNNICLISEGYLGFFSTKFISKYKNEKSNILLKVLSNKLSYEFSRDEIAFVYNQKAPRKIEYIDSTKQIAGYECKKAKVYFNDDAETQIDIFYTLEIGLKSPNRNTPLYQIPGVLMEFETSMNKVKTKFTAQSINLDPVNEEIFNIPEEYKFSDLKTLQKYIVDFN
jgi:GLPGLI family protein